MLRAEKAGSPLVLIKGISYVPVEVDKASAITLEKLVTLRPDYFVRGAKVWAVEWLGALLPHVLGQYMILTETEMVKIIDQCASLGDEAKKQFILDAAMDAEYNSKNKAIWTAKQKPFDYAAYEHRMLFINPPYSNPAMIHIVDQCKAMVEKINCHVCVAAKAKTP